MNHRDELLSLFSSQKNGSVPAFSGLIHITADGLRDQGLSFGEIHHEAQKMAQAAMSTFKITGMPSAALPLDLCAPAEALGARLKFYPDEEMRFPQVVSDFLYSSTKELPGHFAFDLDRGRLGIVCDAISLVKKELGSKVIVSGTIPGPYTLLLYICHPRNLFIEMKKDPQSVIGAVLQLSAFLAELGTAYKNAGADLITIHDMGGSPGFIGPSKFEQFVFPGLKGLISALPAPTVLSICGNTNKSMELLAQTGADAVSVDQTNDLPASRAILQDTLLFGNLDPVHVLAGGSPGDVRTAVWVAIQSGVDAVWPGCDLVPQTPIENLRALQF